MEAVTDDDGVLQVVCPFLPTLNLMITQIIIIMLIARITAIIASPISDARRGMLTAVYVRVGGWLIAI